MKIIIIWIIAGIAYAFNGFMFTKMTNSYLDELVEKTTKINPKFVNKLWVNWYVHSDLGAKVAKTVCWTFWPITCIISILHAEKEYSIIRRQCYRMEP